MWHEMTLPIDSRDVDGHGMCKASALLGHVQEAATWAAEEGGFGRSLVTEQYHSFWMLTRVWFHLNRPLWWSEALTIRTWHRGGQTATMYRDYDLFVGEEQVGECISAWVLADMENRKLLRLGQIPELADTDGGSLCKTKKLSKLVLPKNLTELERRPMRYSDTDINGHVNNTRYADFACDALGMGQRGKEEFLSQLQIGYLAECHPGDVLCIQTAWEGNQGFVRGMDEGSKSRFEAALIFGKVLS